MWFRHDKETFPELNIYVRQWYEETFPEDANIVSTMPRDLTFDWIDESLTVGSDIYDTMQVGDSVVRERVFYQLSVILRCDYDDIYRQWLASAR